MMNRVLVAAILAEALVVVGCGGGGSPTATPEVVSSQSLSAISNELAEAGLIVSGPTDMKPRLSLTEAVAEIETASVRPISGSLIWVEWRDNQGNDIGYINPPRLIWAVRVDPSKSTMPNLYPPDASLTFAFIDANDGKLQGVFSR